MSDYEELATQLEKLTLPEAAGLVKFLEDRWGVSAAAPVMAMAGPAGGATAEAAEEQTEFDVVLEDVGPEKIKVIKAVGMTMGAAAIINTLLAAHGAVKWLACLAFHPATSENPPMIFIGFPHLYSIMGRR